jgi:peptidoglycan/LPS O-acetylase OafA/YrhL
MDSQTKHLHGNNFGLLRLVFATLVIVAHSPEVIDGDRSREILTRIFGTMSFGEVAVDGFFIVSGYLITKSISDQPDVFAFLVKRLARIAPGYLVSFWLCALVLAPFAGASGSVFSPHQLLYNLKSNTSLSPPDVPGTFHGLPFPDLNLPMWTISYEFNCYRIVAVVGLICVLAKLSLVRLRWIILPLVLILIVVNGINANGLHHTADPAHIVKTSELDYRFFAVFGVGAVFYLFKDRIPLTKAGAIGAALLLIVLLFHRQTAEAGIAALGGYLIFWFALKFRTLKISAFTDKTDISYGLYLYAWPMQSLIVWNYRTINPWLLCVLTILGAGLFAYASWSLVEKHALSLARRSVSRQPRGMGQRLEEQQNVQSLDLTMRN